MDETLSPNTLYLTVNSRLSRWLLVQHNTRQKQSGKKAWPTPQVQSLNSWLNETWKLSWSEQFLLTPLQSSRVWENIISEDADFKSLDVLHLPTCAEQAQKAYSLIQQYRLPLNKSLFSYTRETQAFYNWCYRYQSFLKKQKALDSAQLLDSVHSGMDKGDIPVPETIVLAGFEDLTPQLKEWIELLNRKHCAVTIDPAIPDIPVPGLPDLRNDQTLEIRKFKDRKTEVVQLTRWIRSIYVQGKTIGVVVPEMDAYRSLLKRELAAELTPSSQMPWVDREPPFNISMGTALIKEPLVRAACNLLFAKPSMPIGQFTDVILSSFFSPGRIEAQNVASLDLSLRKNNYLSISLSQLLKKTDVIKSPELVKFLRSWKTYLSDDNKKLPSTWCASITNLLNDSGWPTKDTILSPREYQAHGSWKSGLDSLASLDQILGMISRNEVAKQLQRLLAEPNFQVKTKEQPIQVVGQLESAGMKFDHLWVVGCHSGCFPTAPSPNPFLPWVLKNKFNLPHCTAQRELEFAENTFRRWMDAAPNLIFSAPEWDGVTELRLTPILHPLQNRIVLQDIELSHRLKDAFEPSLESFSDPTNIPLLESEKTLFTTQVTKGGTHLIQSQSHCPFKAFAMHRLSADTLELADHDFDFAERGTLIHNALEIFWRKTRSLNLLKQLFANNTLDEMIEQSVRDALLPFNEKLSDQSHFLQMELNRSRKLIRDWLTENEQLRPDFTVLEEEKKEIIQVGELRLSMRMDRVDKTTDGKLLLIDYKTGDAKPGSWFGERPEQPQIPLYAMQLQPDGLTFAQLKQGDMKFKGVYDPDTHAFGFKSVDFAKKTNCENWQSLLDYWRNNLTHLADDFLDGKMQVDPLKVNETCRTCNLQTMCRISEKTGSIVAEEETP